MRSSGMLPQSKFPKSFRVVCRGSILFIGGLNVLRGEKGAVGIIKHGVRSGGIGARLESSSQVRARWWPYSQVTYREAEAAMRACVNAAPVIDGRRANCNLASLGVQRSKPSTPNHGGGRSFRVMSGYQTSGGDFASTSATATLPHYAIHQGIPYANVYGCGYGCNKPCTQN